MKKDITDISDIELLVNTFYETVKADNVIGYIFNDIAKVNWEEHLPVMYSFWQTMLLDEFTYRGNPMTKHIALNQIIKLTEEHFDKWYAIWSKTVDENFAGDNAEAAKQKARSIKDLMIYKIGESEGRFFHK